MSTILPNIKEICLNEEIDTPEKTTLLKNRANWVFQSVRQVCEQNRETLTSVLGNMCALKDKQAQAIVMEVIDMAKNEEPLEKYVTTMRVPDWVLVYFKIKVRISDSTWQTVINFTKLGRTGVSLENCVFVTINSYFNE